MQIVKIINIKVGREKKWKKPKTSVPEGPCIGRNYKDKI